MTHGRKYGEKDSHPIYIWNGVLEPKHLKRLGPALPLFLWLIDRTTKERDGVGVVLGGRPVKAEEIAESMGMYEQTIRRWMDRLENHGYIDRTLTPRGYNVRVMKSCKFPKRTAMVGQDCTTTEGSGRAEMISVVGQECTPTPCKDARPNKSKQLSKQKEEAVVRLPLASFWQEIGIDPTGFSGGILKLCEDLYSTKGNQSKVEFLSVCMDAIQRMGWSIPPQIAQAKAELRASGNGHQRREPMRELEAEPWGAGSGVRQ